MWKLALFLTKLIDNYFFGWETKTIRNTLLWNLLFLFICSEFDEMFWGFSILLFVPMYYFLWTNLPIVCVLFGLFFVIQISFGCEVDRFFVILTWLRQSGIQKSEDFGTFNGVNHVNLSSLNIIKIFRKILENRSLE